MQGQAARYIWSYLGAALGIQAQMINVKSNLITWWRTGTINEVHKLLIHITPIMICWELWKSNCACKYGGQKHFWINKMQHQINWNVNKALNFAFPKCNFPNHWPHLCDIVEKLKHNIICKQVVWNTHPPPTGWVKINTDGSYSAESGKVGIGGLIRDVYGNLIMEFAAPATCASNNMAEAIAAKFGVNWCIANGYRQFILELYSLLIANMLIQTDWESQAQGHH